MIFTIFIYFVLLFGFGTQQENRAGEDEGKKSGVTQIVVY
jgi:hypothetical protein